MVGNDPVNSTDDICSVDSMPARDSGLCRRQGLVTFQAVSPPPRPTLPVSHSPDVWFACLQKGVKSIPRLVFFPPSLSPFATRKSSALYSEQKAEGGGS